MRLLVLVTSVFVYGIELYIKGRRDVVYGAALSIRVRTSGPSLGFIYTVRHPAERKRATILAAMLAICSQIE